MMLAEATGFDLDARTVALRTAAGDETLDYDTLIVGGGSKYNYFGHPEWQEHAAELKSLEGALHIRAQILRAFEAAELAETDEERTRQLTFVVVGAGPTGRRDGGPDRRDRARHARATSATSTPTKTRVLLVEARRPRAGRVPAEALQAGDALAGQPRRHAAARTRRSPTSTPTASRWATSTVSSATVIWAAGVLAAGVSSFLAEAQAPRPTRSGGCSSSRTSRCPATPRCSRSATWCRCAARDPLPGVAPVAMQMGRYAAKLVKGRLRGKRRRPVQVQGQGQPGDDRPRPRGGRAAAAASGSGGFPAWALWLGIHLFYLVGFQNRLLVFIRWGFSFLTHGRGTRLITGEQNMP